MISHFLRRARLFTGLFLTPWILLCAISSIPFSHGRYFEELDKAKGLPPWSDRAAIPYDVPVPEGNELCPLGARILADTGLQGAFGVYRLGPRQINVYVYTVWHSTQVQYLLDEKKLVIRDTRFRWDHMLTGLHAKGGFEQESLVDRSWSVAIDITCLGLLLWIASGFYLWWKLRALRGWGWLAVLGGLTSFGVLVALL